ncbi:uncharacterized protein LOC131298300 isoform X2 [Rhododendron vialii]|uniref:uncharacterized protein LOC131298300 isoform X2 n=1 Tax=Rhododendron vialii TaxID=182163 RepID=UPI00265DFE0C|nr:uncharacterized protein LOC131298300 isoform X2 [Rhododendron vialii]
MVRPIRPETLKKMAPLPGYDGIRIKSGNGVHDNNAWSDEHDCVPLKHRLKMLLAATRLSDSSDSESWKASKGPSVPPIDVVNKEDQHLLQEESNQMFSPEQSQTGLLGDKSSQGTEGNENVSSNGIKSIEANGDTVLVEKVDACSSTLTPCSVLSMYHVKAEVDYPDHNLTTSQGNGVEGALDTELRAVNLRKEIANDLVDDLDHIVLKERRRLLLSRKSLELTKPVLEGNNSWLSNAVVGDTIQHSISRAKKKNHNGDAESLVAGNHTHAPAINASDFNMTSKSGKSKGIIAGSSSTILNHSSSMRSCQGTKSAKPGVAGITENDRTCSSKKASITNESFGHDFASNPHRMLGLALSSTFVNIKAEPLDHGDAHKLEKDAAYNSPSNRVVSVKSELEIPEASYGNEVDHMLLRDRIKLLASREPPSLNSSRNFECLKKTVPCVVDCSPIASESAKPIRINRPRKKRKTATDSVETAMEEDAPGLLQVLIEKGVLVNEIKLYGEPESGEAIDDSEDSFSELEDVILKLFSHRQSQLKLPPLRCTKAEKASYCLACLISLVEQARYLQFLKWPVEWGWCRDLQSFIFVFERHNRIVLERPEYGFATYFFELVDSLPIHWQIKRLVTAMKLTSCSRVTLIENKALMVGEDLTEGEARVLTEYGWIPNTGLGTMLNYCDRVVHDKKNERDSSEWKSKIGKLLMNGYNGGTIVPTDIPKKVIGYSGAQGPEIKLEL